MSGSESATRIEQSRRVRDMFGSIATRYDLLNHLLSGNIDKRWRRRVAKKLYASLESPPDQTARILDVACGTGDLSLTLFEGGNARIIGLDFCRPMLDIASSKASKRGIALPFIEGDALDLPFPDGSFHAATIAFGLRNFANVDAGLQEFFRVLVPGGKLLVLEFSKPRIPILKSLFKVYFSRVLPVLGGLLSGSRSAYEYLPDSVSKFPDQQELASLFSTAGFVDVSFENLTGGIAALHYGKRPQL